MYAALIGMVAWMAFLWLISEDMPGDDNLPYGHVYFKNDDRHYN